MTREEKQAFWQQHMTQWESSTQSQSAYCATHGLKLGTFGYWRTQLCRQRLAGHASEGRADTFLPVQTRSGYPTGMGADEAQVDLGMASIRLPVVHLSTLLPFLLNLPGSGGTR
jgi:hypothetical protein